MVKIHLGKNLIIIFIFEEFISLITSFILDTYLVKHFMIFLSQVSHLFLLQRVILNTLLNFHVLKGMMHKYECKLVTNFMVNGHYNFRITIYLTLLHHLKH